MLFVMSERGTKGPLSHPTRLCQPGALWAMVT